MSFRKLARSPLLSPTYVPVADGRRLRASRQPSPGDIYMSGQSHLDSAWLWTWPTTAQKARTTFGISLQNMRQFPNYTFSASQPAEFDMIARTDPQAVQQGKPALFPAVTEAVQAGRLIPVGGMWVESDTNIPSGEALVRQLLMGQRYLAQHFGQTAHVGWLPDSFGFNATMPQLFQKAGIDSFVTTKLLWNDTNKFPHQLFWWQSPDGSRVLAYQTPDELGKKDVAQLKKDVENVQAHNAIKDVLLLYGQGDGGNGPQPNEVEQVEKLADLGRQGLVPTVHQEGPNAYFEHIRPQAETAHLPTVNDELYLELHRGTYTTDAYVKAMNRRCEEALGDAEKFGVFARACGQAYPDLTDTWKKLLLCQGHDNLPGTVIKPAAQEAHLALSDVLATGQAATHDALSAIAAKIDTRGPGQPLVVFNPLGHDRDDVVSVSRDKLPANFRVLDEAGHEVPWQLERDLHGHETAAFVAKGVPSLGYQTYRIVEGQPGASNSRHVTDSPQALTIETPFLRVRVDKKSGDLQAVQDLRHGDREVLKGNAGGFEIFRDHPKMWDAWNIDAKALEKPLSVLKHADAVKLVEDGPVRTVVQVHRRWHHSDFAQNIVFHHDSPRVDFENKVDWQETHKLLKTSFPLQVESDHATFEIPYGTIERSNHPQTSVEKAKFEVPHQRWEDVSSGDYGASVLNDSKYGSDVKDSVVRLSLLRSAAYPMHNKHLASTVKPVVLNKDNIIDRGEQNFTYSLYPHEGDWRQGGTMTAAADLNQALIPVLTDAHEGKLPSRQSFAQVEGNGVVLEAIKKAEDSDDVVLRLYETNGEASQAKIRLNGPIAKAVETNLLEEGDTALPVEDGAILAPFSPHEIKTIKVSL